MPEADRSAPIARRRVRDAVRSCGSGVHASASVDRDHRSGHASGLRQARWWLASCKALARKPAPFGSGHDFDGLAMTMVSRLAALVLASLLALSTAGPAAAQTAGKEATMAIDLPEVKAEVEAAFAAYEKALVTNDVPALEAFFFDDPRTIRYGIGENLYGMDAIRAFRRGRSPVGLSRTLSRTVITTFGRDTATAMTLFTRESAPKRVGRQSQTWVRMKDGWKIVSAHVSVIDEP